jgi:hypothetical protein
MCASPTSLDYTFYPLSIEVFGWSLLGTSLPHFTTSSHQLAQLRVTATLKDFQMSLPQLKLYMPILLSTKYPLCVPCLMTLCLAYASVRMSSIFSLCLCPSLQLICPDLTQKPSLQIWSPSTLLKLIHLLKYSIVFILCQSYTSLGIQTMTQTPFHLQRVTWCLIRSGIQCTFTKLFMCYLQDVSSLFKDR